MAGSKKRLRRLLVLLAGLLTLGLSYAWIVSSLGAGIPCPFYQFTGFFCPGCGVTRMCMALLRGEWGEAWAANPGVCLLVPPMTVLLVCRAVGYVKGRLPRRWEERSWLILALGLLAFGVWRNLPSIFR